MFDAASIALALCAAGLVGILLFKSFRNERKKSLDDENGRRLGRTMSFTSASMALGTFPEEKKVPDPIMNVAIFYAANNCPDKKDVVPIVETFLKYQRCAGVPTEVRRNVMRTRECINVNPESMIRTLVVHGDDQVTQDTITTHMQDSLSEGRGDVPWWEFLLIKNEGTGMSALVLRMHHSIGDGLSLVALLEHFITYTDGTPLNGLIPESMSRKFKIKKGKLRLLFDSVVAFVRVLSLSMSRFDDDTAFSKSINKSLVYSGKRKCVMFKPIPLEFVKELKNAADVTVNDVLFTCLSQALHDYNVEQNCPVMKSVGSKVQCRALLCVGFPRPYKETAEKSNTMRNKWVFVSTDMGVGLEDEMSRLQYVHDHFMSLKQSPMAYIQLKVQEYIAPMLPRFLARQTVFDTFCRHSLVFSNVPGPFRPCNFAGKEAIGAHLFFNNLVPQMSVISYRGQVFANIILDPEAIPNSERIPILFQEALIKLAHRLNVNVPSSLA